MIEESLRQSPQTGKRLDDGMAIIAFKVRGTLTDYYPRLSNVEIPGGPFYAYYLQQAFPLLPFMTDRSILPEIMKTFLDKSERRAAAQKSK